jgi:hypothetical protein
VWVYSQSGCQGFRVDSINSHASRSTTKMQILHSCWPIEKPSNSMLAFELELVNKFKLVYTMTKKRMSQDFFADLCSAAELLSVPTMYAQPLENGQSPH